LEDLKKLIRTVPHWPKQGVMFRDVTTLMKDPAGFRKVIDTFVHRYVGKKIDAIVGIDARGFILGGAIAHQLGKGFIPVRKPGKLPAETIEAEYMKEYGPDKLAMHKDAITKGMNVIICDDLIATGGTALAAAQLVENLGGKIFEFAFVVDLPELGGKKLLESKGYKVYNMIEFEGE
jgi:adenine phosphoribosyltransferase